MYCSSEMYFCCGQPYNQRCICDDVDRLTREFCDTNARLHVGISNHIRKLWPDLCSRLAKHYKASFESLRSQKGDTIDRDLVLIAHRLNVDRRWGIKYAEIKLKSEDTEWVPCELSKQPNGPRHGRDTSLARWTSV